VPCPLESLEQLVVHEAEQPLPAADVVEVAEHRRSGHCISHIHPMPDGDRCGFCGYYAGGERMFDADPDVGACPRKRAQPA
jgi:hypothetical protein